MFGQSKKVKELEEALKVFDAHSVLSAQKIELFKQIVQIDNDIIEEQAEIIELLQKKIMELKNKS